MKVLLILLLNVCCMQILLSNASVIKSKSVSKFGDCPDTTGQLGICVHDCDHDVNCPGIKKCCSNGCGKVCSVPFNSVVATPINSLIYLSTNESWDLYKIKYGKQYTPEEEIERRKIWSENVKIVNTHNEGFASGVHSWSQGMNKFSDGTKPFTGLIRRPKVNKLIIPVEFFTVNNQSWTDYVNKFAKNYTDSSEELASRQEWEKNIELVNLHNSGFMAGNHSFTMGVNQFSDGTKPAMGLVRQQVDTLYIANNQTWEMYKETFVKNYTLTEEAEKRTKWEFSIDAVNKHNEEFKNGTHSWTQGINKFSDGSLPGKGLLIPENVSLNPAIVSVELYVANDKTWEDYKKQWNKVYTQVEEPEKRKSWEASVVSVNKHNEDYKKGIHGWWQGINLFSDGTRPGMGYLKPVKETIILTDDQTWSEYPHLEFDDQFSDGKFDAENKLEISEEELEADDYEELEHNNDYSEEYDSDEED